MSFALYESMENWCDNDIIFENIEHIKWVMSVWCEDCQIRHNFGLTEVFDSIEDMWAFLREEDNGSLFDS
jgi:hypothetical protein